MKRSEILAAMPRSNGKAYSAVERRRIGRALAASLKPVMDQREVAKRLKISRAGVFYIEERTLYKIFINMTRSSNVPVSGVESAAREVSE